MTQNEALAQRASKYIVRLDNLAYNGVESEEDLMLIIELIIYSLATRLPDEHRKRVENVFNSAKTMTGLNYEDREINFKQLKEVIKALLREYQAFILQE